MAWDLDREGWRILRVDRVEPVMVAPTGLRFTPRELPEGGDLAVYLGMLGADFAVAEPPELVARLRALAARYRRATT